MLILIPGLLNDADLWRDQVAALSGRFDVQVADITQGETMEALVDGVSQWLTVRCRWPVSRWVVMWRRPC